MLYTDILHSKMKKNSYFDDEGQFDVHKPVGYTAEINAIYLSSVY